MNDSPPPVAGQKQGPIRTFLGHLGTLGFLALLAGTTLVASASSFWLGEVATSFTWQLGWAGALGATALLAIRRRRLAAAASLISLILLAPELALWLPAEPPSKDDPQSAPLKLATCNLLWGNTDAEGVTAWLKSTAPDIIAFQEVSLAALPVLKAQSKSYPFLSLAPPEAQWHQGTWGTAFLSKVPVLSQRLIPAPEGIARDPMEITIPWNGRQLILRNVHPPRPGRAHRNQERNQVLSCLAQQDWSGPSILLGDLNVTSSSPVFTALLETTGLRDSRQGFGRQPTYTTGVLIPGLSIAIDHALVSKDIQVQSRETQLTPGSDHRSVVLTITTIK